MNRAFNWEVQHRAEPLCGSKRMLAFNFEIASEPSFPVLVVACAYYRKQFCTRHRLPHISLRWSEEKSFFGRVFYKHLAPNRAKSHKTLLHLKLNPPMVNDQ